MNEHKKRYRYVPLPLQVLLGKFILAVIKNGFVPHDCALAQIAFPLKENIASEEGLT